MGCRARRCALLKQQQYGTHMALLCRLVKRCESVFSPRIQVGTRTGQQRNGPAISADSGHVQWCRSQVTLSRRGYGFQRIERVQFANFIEELAEIGVFGCVQFHGDLDQGRRSSCHRREAVANGCELVEIDHCVRRQRSS